MSGVDFLDSTVSVHLVDGHSPAKQAVAQRIVDAASSDGSAVTIDQAVRKTVNVLAQTLRPSVSREDRSALLSDVLVPLWTVQPSAALLDSADDLRLRLGFAFHDSPIVAAALEAGCKRLLIEDLQHGQAHRRAADRAPVPLSGERRYRPQSRHPLTREPSDATHRDRPSSSVGKTGGRVSKAGLAVAPTRPTYVGGGRAEREEGGGGAGPRMRAVSDGMVVVPPNA